MANSWEPNKRQYIGSPKNSVDPYIKKDKSRMTKFIIQFVSSFFIFLFIWVSFTMEGPGWTRTQAAMRDWFTKDSDVEAAFNVVKKVGLYGDSFERAGFEVMSPIKNDIESMTIPVSGTVKVPFGWKNSDGKENFHSGIVIEAEVGTPIKAAYKGTVLEVKEDEKLGRELIISHENGLVTKYGYCSEILVKEDQPVKEGQIIAKVGEFNLQNKGYLYFEANRLGEPINPLDLLEIEKNI